MKRSDRMNNGKMLAMAAVVVMIAASLACVMPVVSDSESYAVETGSTVNISVDQVKQSIISVNETAFEFVDTNKDGIKIGYVTEDSQEQINAMLTYSYKEGSWQWDNTSSSKNFTYYTLNVVEKTKLDGKYTLQFTGNEAASNQTLKIRISITSQGATQSIDYNYTVNVYKSFNSYSKIIYPVLEDKTLGGYQASGTVGGTFSSSAPSVYYTYTDDETNEQMNPIDTENFIFYATGFYKGVALDNSNLSIKGSVPADMSGWSGDSMKLTFAVTDKRTGYVVIIKDVEVKYTLHDAPTLNYMVAYAPNGGDVVTWSQGNGNVTATLVSGGTLNITGSSDCVATIIYENNGQTTTNRVTLEDSDGEIIDISGTGKMIITVSVLGVEEQTLEFTIIDDMIPVNSIDVTCGPDDTNP